MKIIFLLLACMFLGLGVLDAQESPPSATDVAALKQEIEKLKATVADSQTALEKMQKRLDELEQKGGVAVPAETKQPEATPSTPTPGGTGGGTATLNPDVSVIGTGVGRFSADNIADKNKVVLDELELALEGWLYPDVQGKAFISFPREGNGTYGTELEEAYVNFTNLDTVFGVGKNWSVKAGQMRVPFGKINSLHPHVRPYIDQPSVLTNFFGPDGFKGVGLNASYLMPNTGDWFVQTDFDYWEPTFEDEPGTPGDSPVSAGLQDKAYSSRIWASRSLSENSELELGASALRGRMPIYDSTTGTFGDLEWGTVLGLDMTWKEWASKFRRKIVQAELMRLSKDTTSGGDSLYGGYLYAGNQLDQYNTVGLLYDRSQFADSGFGYEQSLSGIFSRQLTETTTLRTQLKRSFGGGAGEDDTQLLFQLIWGFGPHSHPLQ